MHYPYQDSTPQFDSIQYQQEQGQFIMENNKQQIYNIDLKENLIKKNYGKSYQFTKFSLLWYCVQVEYKKYFQIPGIIMTNFGRMKDQVVLQLQQNKKNEVQALKDKLSQKTDKSSTDILQHSELSIIPQSALIIKPILDKQFLPEPRLFISTKRLFACEQYIKKALIMNQSKSKEIMPQKKQKIPNFRSKIFTFYQELQNKMKQISNKIKTAFYKNAPKQSCARYTDNTQINVISQLKIKQMQNMEPQKDSYKLQQPSTIQNQQKIAKKIFIGQAGVGKTSLLNFYFNTKFAVGLGECTSEITEVIQTKTGKIYDSYPLKVQQFNDCNPQEYQQFCKYDEIYILYSTSLKNISRVILKIVEQKGSSKTIFFIRTKCDTFHDKQLRSYQEQCQVDRNLLIKWGLRPDQISIFGVSSKYNSKMSSLDNQKVYNLLLK